MGGQGLRETLERAEAENARLRRGLLFTRIEELGFPVDSIPAKLLLSEYRPDDIAGYSPGAIKLWLAVELGTSL